MNKKFSREEFSAFTGILFTSSLQRLKTLTKNGFLECGGGKSDTRWLMTEDMKRKMLDQASKNKNRKGKKSPPSPDELKKIAEKEKRDKAYCFLRDVKFV